ncbi:MAG: ankyrin repeat domain-containing protein [Methyloprofundus sp.]|nr:ankyrin repeat domain-containing protein [Methyloprofundus sp.]
MIDIERWVDMIDNRPETLIPNLKRLKKRRGGWVVDPRTVTPSGFSLMLDLGGTKESSYALVVSLSGSPKEDITFNLSFSVETEDIKAGNCFTLNNRPHILSIRHSSDFEALQDTGVPEALRNNSTLLICAVEDGNIERVKTLLDYGFNPNAFGYSFKEDPGSIMKTTPLVVAALGNQLSIAKLLLKRNALTEVEFRPYETWWDALFYAVTKGNIDMTSLLVKNGAQINAQDNDGQTPLSLAVTLSMENSEPQPISDLLKSRLAEIETEKQNAYRESVKKLIGKKESEVNYCEV